MSGSFCNKVVRARGRERATVYHEAGVRCQRRIEKGKIQVFRMRAITSDGTRPRWLQEASLSRVLIKQRAQITACSLASRSRIGTGYGTRMVNHAPTVRGMIERLLCWKLIVSLLGRHNLGFARDCPSNITVSRPTYLIG
jgi:hypothetical protein